MPDGDSNNHDYTDCCALCGLGFTRHSDFTLHLVSDEHENMILATGEYDNMIQSTGEYDNMIQSTGEYDNMILATDEHDNMTQAIDNNFPPLYYCVLCNVSCFTHDFYDNHLKSNSHLNMAEFLGCFSSRNIENNVSMSNNNLSVTTDTENIGRTTPASSYQSFSRPSYLMRYCDICEHRCNDDNKYKHHLKSKLHVRKREFLTKMLKRKSKWNLYISYYVEVSGTPRSLLFYCELCNILFHDLDSYAKHLRCSIHRRIVQLINKISTRIDESVIGACSDTQASANDSVPPVHYCCEQWFSDATFQYHRHNFIPHNVHITS